ncbi:thiamine-phosphate kinase [Acetobacter peroxydans]|jgi:thiamine-monophosphate kinase|uniref:thiamine-phosphate kinase n=2 Tax=Acetobacter peroxydans TaxID=104098 RepID=UPI00235610B3|nr:thiamine-phosphate kinase [Acetobacter peroxydans]MCI1395218.1 thiamine-phosphate kinase [Acetobacter peroxydans]MCI1411010.1 thiamine-phosphate kinase [Acetobacter peroxydans]MCI1439422.1 thiamine-phosphate kinase [Acetobacter peroxydans]MCI1566827.1 thiamine-phosphate kinase [Acetobacter peroxydans]MCI1618376.1 thiamine-phosphate kinase [Acetobacter peroxydans]
MTRKPTASLTDLPGEFSFIRRCFTGLAGPAALGLRDDAALFTPPPGRELVIAADAMVENVHFLPSDPPDTVGGKLLRCNLSDLAAMGAQPEGWLLTLARPPHISDEWFEAFSLGLKADQERFGLTLMGGDTTSTTGPLVLSLTIIGSVLPGQAVQRRGAQAGDGLWVTGTIGDGALGLQALLGNIPDPSGILAQRYRTPEPRIGLPLYGLASAAMDVSDGLVQDAGHLARENGLSVTIQAADVPLSEAAQAAGQNWLETCLTGGDDYEILMAIPPEREQALLRHGVLQTPHGPVSLTRIGTFSTTTGSGEQPGVRVVDTAGAPMVFKRGGWSHL